MDEIHPHPRNTSRRFSNRDFANIARAETYDKIPVVNYDHLTYEDPLKIKEIIGTPDSHIATVAASGASAVIALTEGATHVDAIDSSPEQIAFNYALQCLLVSLPAENFSQQFALFNQRDISLREASTQIRKNVINGLPALFDELNIPEKYRKNITKFMEYQKFPLDTDLAIPDSTVQTWQEPDHIAQIQSAIKEKRWQLHEADLVSFLQNQQPGTYDAVYTSNVYDHLLQAKDWQGTDGKNTTETVQQTFSQALSHAVKPGGKVNIHNLFRPGDDDAAWQPLPIDRSIWYKSWQVQDSRYILRGQDNGTWYNLIKPADTAINK